MILSGPAQGIDFDIRKNSDINIKGSVSKSD
jgi:hypothetical protein